MPERRRRRAEPLGGAARGRVGDLPPGRPDARRSRQEPFLVTETNATSIGELARELPRLRRPVAPGGVGARRPRRADGRVLALAHASTSATRRTGCGVLGHDGEPGRCYDEVERIAGEFDARRRPPSPTSCPTPTSRCCTRARASGRWSSIRRWPARAGPSPTAAPTTASSRASTRACSAPACRPTSSTPQHLGSDADALVARWPVLVVPALYVADDALLDLLDAYARAGGHLVLGFRSGYADEEARRAPEVMPGRLREAVGRDATASTRTSRAGAAAVGRGLRPARRRGRDRMGGRARARGRRDARRLRASAPRALAGGDHPRARRRAA